MFPFKLQPIQFVFTGVCPDPICSLIMCILCYMYLIVMCVMLYFLLNEIKFNLIQLKIKQM